VLYLSRGEKEKKRATFLIIGREAAKEKKKGNCNHLPLPKEKNSAPCDKNRKKGKEKGNS